MRPPRFFALFLQKTYVWLIEFKCVERKIIRGYGRKSKNAHAGTFHCGRFYCFFYTIKATLSAKGWTAER